jgi:hypothetical protein
MQYPARIGVDIQIVAECVQHVLDYYTVVVAAIFISIRMSWSLWQSVAFVGV